MQCKSGGEKEEKTVFTEYCKTDEEVLDTIQMKKPKLSYFYKIVYFDIFRIVEQYNPTISIISCAKGSQKEMSYM